MFKGFREFIVRGNVLDLAIAVVIGGAFNTVVNSIVRGFVTPLIGVFGGNANFSSAKFKFANSEFLVGDIISSVISFIVVSAVVYFLIVVPMNKLNDKVQKGQKVDPSTKVCTECLSAIPIKAKRCKYCTSVQKI